MTLKTILFAGICLLQIAAAVISYGSAMQERTVSALLKADVRNAEVNLNKEGSHNYFFMESNNCTKQCSPCSR